MTKNYSKWFDAIPRKPTLRELELNVIQAAKEWCKTREASTQDEFAYAISGIPSPSIEAYQGAVQELEYAVIQLENKERSK